MELINCQRCGGGRAAEPLYMRVWLAFWEIYIYIYLFIYIIYVYASIQLILHLLK